jgi:hypothetical protein
MDYPTFANKTEEIKFIRENLPTIFAEKRMTLKTADAISFSTSRVNDKGDTIKASENSGESQIGDSDTIKVRSVINTTNLMDSHRDVHVKGIWTKSIQEQKNLYLLQEHKMTFKNIISDKVKALTKFYEWKELGYNYEGKTQALLFDSTISKDRNEYMFEQYAKGHVKNHSVGMRYVKLGFASNDENYPEEKALWDKYINTIGNKEEAISNGYFYAVTEAKIIEGSAVPLGSNPATPTMSVESKDIEPSSDTQGEPFNDTQNDKRTKGSSLYF